MANKVEVEIGAKDTSAAAVRSAREGLISLNREVKGMGQAFQQAGRFATVFGGEQIANLTLRAQLMSNTFKSATEVIAKIGLARAGIAGVVIAMAGWVAQRALAEKQKLAEQIKEEAEAHKTLEKNIKATTEAQAALNAKIKEGAISKQAGAGLQSALGNQSLTQGARAAGVVIGDPINGPINQAKAVEDLAKKEAESNKQKLEAQKLIADKNNENWEMYEAILEAQRLKEKELSDAKIAAEEEGWEIYDAITEDKRAKEAEMARREEEYARRRIEIAQFDRYQKKMMQQAIVNETSQAFGNMAATALAFGKKGFAAYKAFASAQALIDTYKSANAAYSALAGIPIVGPALAVAAAAAAIAAGIANVAAINSQQPQAHSGLDYVPEDATYALKKGEMVLDPGTSDEVRENASNRSWGGGDIILDSIKITRWIYEMSRNGQLKISSRALVA